MASGNPHESGRLSGVLTGDVGNMKAVKFSGDPTADTTTGQTKPQLALAADPTADQLAGVAYEGGDSGDSIEVLSSGIVEMEAGAAFDRSAGEQYATYNSDGDPIPYVEGAGQECLGRVLFVNGKDIADGDPIFIELGVKPAPKTKSGTATVAAGGATAAIALGAALDGQPAVACIQQGADDGTATYVKRVEWDGAGQLTVTLNANATADVTVAYRVG